MVELGVAAFVVVVLELVLVGALYLRVVRPLWRQLQPQLAPLLAMFTPAQRIAEYTPDPVDDDPRSSGK